MFIVYELATGRVRWTCSISPDLTFDPALGSLQVADDAFVQSDGSLRNAGGYIVVNGALADRVATLGESRAAQTNAAVAHYNALIAAGFTYGGALFQIDSAAQANIAAMGVMALGSITDPAGSPWPAGFYWIAADNSHLPMDAAQMYAFGRAAGAYVSACVLRLRAIKDAIASAPDQAALDAIDVTAGYPPAGV